MEAQRLQALRTALEEVRSYTQKLSQPHLPPQTTSGLLEKLRAACRRITKEQPAGFRWRDVLAKEGLGQLLQSLSAHDNPKIASRAVDTRSLLDSFVRIDEGGAQLHRTIGAQRNAGQEGYADVRIHMGAIQTMRELFRANDTAGVETLLLLYGGRLAAAPHTAHVLTDILQARSTEPLGSMYHCIKL